MQRYLIRPLYWQNYLYLSLCSNTHVKDFPGFYGLSVAPTLLITRDALLHSIVNLIKSYKLRELLDE